MSTNGYGAIISPANSPFAITVGAMKDTSSTSRGDDLIASYSSKVASYSSKGPTLVDHFVKPDLVPVVAKLLKRRTQTRSGMPPGS
jgi:serine protease AprX